MQEVFFVGVSVNVEPEIREYTQTSAKQFDSSSPCWVSLQQKVAKAALTPLPQIEAQSQLGGEAVTDPRACGLYPFYLLSLIKDMSLH